MFVTARRPLWAMITGARLSQLLLVNGSMSDNYCTHSTVSARECHVQAVKQPCTVANENKL